MAEQEKIPGRKLPESGTFKMNKETGQPERLTVNPIVPGVEDALNKMGEGAHLAELDEIEQHKIKLNAYKNDEKRILEEIAKEKGPEVPLVAKNYGVFGDMTTVFALVHEQVGPFNRYEHKTVTYKDLVVWEPMGNQKEGYRENFEKPSIAKTKENVDRLVALGAIRPLIRIA
jgi:hypothetical protein